MWIESFPGRAVREAWLYLTPEEAQRLHDALSAWIAGDAGDEEWETSLTDADRALTVAIGPHVGTEAFARRFRF